MIEDGEVRIPKAIHIRAMPKAISFSISTATNSTSRISMGACARGNVSATRIGCFIKAKDEEARGPRDRVYLRESHSVVTGRSIEEIADGKGKNGSGV